MVDARHR